MRKLIVAVFALFAAHALTACNTMEGFGQDVSKVGNKIENSADKNKK